MFNCNSKLLSTELCDKLIKNSTSKRALIMRTCHFQKKTEKNFNIMTSLL